MNYPLSTIMPTLRCPLCRHLGSTFRPALRYIKTDSFPRYEGYLECRAANCDYESQLVGFDEVATLMDAVSEWLPDDAEMEELQLDAMRPRLEAIHDRLARLETDLTASNAKVLCIYVIDALQKVLNGKDPFEEREEYHES